MYAITITESNGQTRTWQDDRYTIEYVMNMKKWMNDANREAFWSMGTKDVDEFHYNRVNISSIRFAKI